MNTDTDPLWDAWVEEEHEHTDVSGTSGDLMLKKLVDLAHLGWSADLIILTNGMVMRGTLISPKTFLAAAAQSITTTSRLGPLETLDQMIGAALETDELGNEWAPSSAPEPRYIHLANVTTVPGGRKLSPFLRMRLPAVSAFWVEAERGSEREAR